MATKKNKEIIKKSPAKKDLAPGELQKLANSGTKEAIAKIEQYLKNEKDEEKRAYLEIALEECEFLYYQPMNEKEDQEFMLAELIRRRKIDLDDLMAEAGSVQMKFDKLMLEKKIHDKILAKNKDKKDIWKYNYNPEALIIEQDALQQLEDIITYEEVWIAEAKKMITTARYKNIPDRYLEHFSFDFDDEIIEDVNDIIENEDFTDACQCDDDCYQDEECCSSDDDCCKAETE